MKILEDDGSSQQQCRACNVNLLVEREDVIIPQYVGGWFHFRCPKCNRLNELKEVPNSLYNMLVRE